MDSGYVLNGLEDDILESTQIWEEECQHRPRAATASSTDVESTVLSRQMDVTFSHTQSSVSYSVTDTELTDTSVAYESAAEECHPSLSPSPENHSSPIEPSVEPSTDAPLVSAFEELNIEKKTIVIEAVREMELPTPSPSTASLSDFTLRVSEVAPPLPPRRSVSVAPNDSSYKDGELSRPAVGARRSILRTTMREPKETTTALKIGQAMGSKVGVTARAVKTGLEKIIERR